MKIEMDEDDSSDTSLVYTEVSVKENCCSITNS